MSWLKSLVKSTETKPQESSTKLVQWACFMEYTVDTLVSATPGPQFTNMDLILSQHG